MLSIVGRVEPGETTQQLHKHNGFTEVNKAAAGDVVVALLSLRSRVDELFKKVRIHYFSEVVVLFICIRQQH